MFISIIKNNKKFLAVALVLFFTLSLLSLGIAQLVQKGPSSTIKKNSGTNVEPGASPLPKYIAGLYAKPWTDVSKKDNAQLALFLKQLPITNDEVEIRYDKSFPAIFIYRKSQSRTVLMDILRRYALDELYLSGSQVFIETRQPIDNTAQYLLEKATYELNEKDAHAQQ